MCAENKTSQNVSAVRKELTRSIHHCCWQKNDDDNDGLWWLNAQGWGWGWDRLYIYLWVKILASRLLGKKQQCFSTVHSNKNRYSKYSNQHVK